MKRIIEWSKEAVYHFLAYVAAALVVGSLLTCKANGADCLRDFQEGALDLHEAYDARLQALAEARDRDIEWLEGQKQSAIDKKIEEFAERISKFMLERSAVLDAYERGEISGFTRDSLLFQLGTEYGTWGIINFPAGLLMALLEAMASDICRGLGARRCDR